MAKNLQRIDAAVIDGRAQAPRYIQRELTRLYETLQKSQSSIQHAISRDTGLSSAEIESETYLTFKAIKQEYESIDFSKVLEQEYSIAHTKDNISRRVPVGCVYIIPAQHTRFYSIIHPLATAIAAGNCVVIEISQTLLELESLLKKLLTTTLDKDTFTIVDSRPQEADLSHYCVVDGRSEPSVLPNATRGISTPSSRSLAIVDRTAQINESAREIVRARFSFHGKSPYSPGVVLVNEFAVKEFCSAAARYAAEQVGSYIPDPNSRKPKVDSNSDLQKEIQKSNSTTLFSGARGSIVLVQDRKSKLLTTKTTDPVLLVHCIRSLDDGIDLSNTLSPSPLDALYLFSDPATAKYLSQFIPSRISFTNHIPVELLVGPPSPKDHPPTIQPRYTKEMFSHASPEHITPSPDHKLLAQLLDNTTDKESRLKIKKASSASLTSMKEPAGWALGFFEQGLYVGAVTALTVIVGALVVTGRYVVPEAVRRIR